MRAYLVIGAAALSILFCKGARAQIPLDVLGFPVAMELKNQKFSPAQTEELRGLLRRESERTGGRYDAAEPVPAALARASQAGPNALAELLGSNDRYLRELALRALAIKWGPGAKLAVPKILDVIEAPGEGTPAERDHTTALAIRAVGRIAPREYVVINALAVRLGRTTDLPPAMRLALIEVLGQAGPSARAALPRLNVELTNASAQFQYAALQAIGSIEAIDPPSLGDLLEKLPTRLPASRLPAELVTIRKAGGEARALVPDLVKVAASDSPKYLQCWALEALAAAGSNDLCAFELALKRAASEDAFVSQLATQVLARIELKAEQAVPVLSQSLSHSNVSIRLSCAAAVKRFGPAAAAATGSLIRALENCGAQSSEDEIGAYLEALKSIGPAAASAGETIVALLDERASIFQDRAKYQVHHLRGFMLATLAEIGVPKSAWPHILDSLANTGRRSAYVFAAGARAAAQLGPAAKAALPYLLKPMTREISDNVLTFETYSSHQSSTREYTNCLIESIRALARMGGEARSALPFLQELSKPDPFARDNPNRLMRLPNVAEEARNAIKAIES